MEYILAIFVALISVVFCVAIFFAVLFWLIGEIKEMWEILK